MIVIDNNPWMLLVSLICLVHFLKVSVEERVNILAVQYWIYTWPAYLRG